MAQPAALTGALLLEALDLAGVACWVWQAETQTLSVSENFHHLLGEPAPHGSLTLDDWLARAHPDERSRLGDLFRRDAPEPLTTALRMRHANGAWVWFEVRARPARENAGTLVLSFNEATEQRQTEAALRDSQLRYRTLYTTSPLAFILWNREGYITEWNRRAEMMFGWRSDEVIGKRIHHLLLPETVREPFATSVRQVVQDEGEGHFTGPGMRKDGFLLHCNWYNVPLRSSQGSLLGILSLVLDVTDEKNAADQLHKSEKVYRTLVETSPDAILMMDLRGRLLTANQQAQQIFNLDVLEDLAGLNLRDLIPESPQAEEVLALLAAPEEYMGFIVNRALPLQSRDGRRFDASLAFTTVMDSQGQATGMVLFARDITARLASERELEGHRRNLEALVTERTVDLETTRDTLSQIIDGSPVPTFVLDANHVITHWNKACEQIIGVPASAMIGTRDQWRAFYAAPRPVMADLVMTGEMAAVERLYGEKYRRSNVVAGGFEGEDFFASCNRWLFFTAAPLLDASGRIIGAIETLQDVSERKQAEMALVDAKQIAEAAANTKAEFLANMSHEIRTPMNAVIGLAHLLRKTELSHKQHDYVCRIQGAGEILLRLINDVLDFSKIEAGRMQLEAADFKLDDMLGNVSTIVLTRAQEKGLELHYVVEPDVPMHLVGDSLRLTQILVNLIGNAIKFTTHGGVTTFIRRQPTSDGRVQLEIDVQDTGIGMSLEQQGRLFQAFTQADTSITRQYGGTGLGLTISKRLVELMDGRIWVTSQPNVGSTFSFVVVLGPGIEEPIAHNAPADSPRRVLVVDDNPLARTVVSRLLENQGCQIRTCNSGREALGVLEESGGAPFDFITIDLNMPEMDGLELAAAIRTLLPTPPRLVLVTAADTHLLEDRGELSNFDAVLNKPVTAAQIGNLLQGGPLVPPKPVYAVPSSLRGRRVLLAEDIPTNQLIATEMLQSLGITVETADNGRLALEMMQAHGQRFDAILMDMQMPEMDGLEATRRIRELPHGKIVPIIAMTAHALDAERERCLEAGMNDFVTKPVDPEILFKALVKAIGNPVETPVVTPSVSEPADALPELPGIDKVAGLKRMMNKITLYRRVLTDFHARFADEGRVIRAALQANDYATAERHAHSTKGLAGSIGATRLQATALALEIAIRNGGYPEAELADYQGALDEVIGGIQRGIIG